MHPLTPSHMHPSLPHCRHERVIEEPEVIYEASDESDKEEETQRLPVHRIIESDSERWGGMDEGGMVWRHIDGRMRERGMFHANYEKELKGVCWLGEGGYNNQNCGHFHREPVLILVY